MNSDERKKKYLAYYVGYGSKKPEPLPDYDGAELGQSILGRMKLGKD